MKALITLAVALLMASFLMEARVQADDPEQYSEAIGLAWGLLSTQQAITCAPGNTHRPDDTTRCGCATDMECEHGIRHDPGDDDE